MEADHGDRGPWDRAAAGPTRRAGVMTMLALAFASGCAFAASPAGAGAKPGIPTAKSPKGTVRPRSLPSSGSRRPVRPATRCAHTTEGSSGQEDGGQETLVEEYQGRCPRYRAHVERARQEQPRLGRLEQQREVPGQGPRASDRRHLRGHIIASPCRPAPALRGRRDARSDRRRRRSDLGRVRHRVPDHGVEQHHAVRGGGHQPGVRRRSGEHHSYRGQVVGPETCTRGAALVCDSLVLGGYSDWYLPSKGELGQLWVHRVAIGGFSLVSRYWSSSEFNSTRRP